MPYLDKFHDLLFSGEELIWTSKAGGGFMLMGDDIFRIPFSLVWTTFAIAIEYSALSQASRIANPGKSQFTAVVGMLFVGVAVYLTVGRFLLDACIRSKTFYAVTDRRVLILREGLFASLKSFQLSELHPAQLRGETSRTGTIDLSSPDTFETKLSSWVPSLSTRVRFFRIENASNVFSLIQKAQLRSKSMPSPVS